MSLPIPAKKIAAKKIAAKKIAAKSTPAKKIAAKAQTPAQAVVAFKASVNAAVAVFIAATK